MDSDRPETNLSDQLESIPGVIDDIHNQIKKTLVWLWVLTVFFVCVGILTLTGFVVLIAGLAKTILGGFPAFACLVGSFPSGIVIGFQFDTVFSARKFLASKGIFDLQRYQTKLKRLAGGYLGFLGTIWILIFLLLLSIIRC